MAGKDILLKIIQTRPNLPTFHLQKLSYLFDLAFVQLTGEIKTNFQYEWCLYGPYSRDIDRTTLKLKKEGKIRIEYYVTRKGHECYLHSPKIKTPPKLTKSEEKILNYIMRHYASLSTEKLKDFVYSTPPMKEAQKKDKLFEELDLKIKPKSMKLFYKPEIVKMIIDSENDYKKGKTVPLETVLQKIGA